MQESDIPIDVHIGKLVEWLISRRHCDREWQQKAIQVREKINVAIQDMPPVEEVTQLLSGSYINYFHCLRIIEILKSTEASTKNFFGQYSSKRMKDWQEIVKLYETNNMYLVEASQMLSRAFVYEIPALRKHIGKTRQTQEELVKKEHDYVKASQDFRNQFEAECKNLGIQGKCIKRELLALLDELPAVFNEACNKLKTLTPAIDFYQAFLEFTFKNETPDEVLPVLGYILEHGNVTTYEYRTGKAPDVIEVVRSHFEPSDSGSGATNDDQIDFGDLDAPSGGSSVPSTTNGDFVHIDKMDLLGDGADADEISWDISVEGDGANEIKDIVVESDDGVARGTDAMSLLHNSETRDALLNELVELEYFLMHRAVEMDSTDTLSAAILQQADITRVQAHSIEAVRKMAADVKTITAFLTTTKLQHLYQLLASPKYVDRLVSNLEWKLTQSEKMLASRDAVIARREETLEEQRQLEPKLDLMIEKAKQLKSQIEQDISKRYKNRPVNIIGDNI